MSNLRLKDHTWDAANVYDSALGKTQEQINAEVGTSLAGKQGTLVSGENIKTINGASILDSGNIEIEGGGTGEDGYSPVVTISNITGGHRVNITDKTHQQGQNFDVMDGAKGDTGDPAPASAVVPAVESWLEDNITQETGYVIDDSLTVTGAAADAKKTGDELSDLKSAIGDYTSPYNPSFKVIAGGISINGENLNNTARCRTQYFNVSAKTTYFAILTGSTYKFVNGFVYTSDTQGSVYGEAFVVDDNHIIFTTKARGKARISFAIAADPEQDITSEDMTAIKAALNIYKLTDETLSMENVPADAKTTGVLLNGIQFIPYQLNEFASATYPTGWRSGMWGNGGSVTSDENDRSICLVGRIGMTAAQNKDWVRMMRIIFPAHTQLVMKRFSYTVSGLLETITFTNGFALFKINENDRIAITLTGLTPPSSDYLNNTYISQIAGAFCGGFDKAAFKPRESEFTRFTVPINKKWPDVSSTTDADAESDTAQNIKCLVALPTNYATQGKPCPLIMFGHGASCQITDDSWYGNNTNFLAMIRKFTQNGYAVFDVNNTRDDPGGNPDWGCLPLMEAYVKAWQYVRANYNVEDKLYLLSDSMGTAANLMMLKWYSGSIIASIMTAPRPICKERYAAYVTAGNRETAIKMLIAYGLAEESDLSDSTFELPPATVFDAPFYKGYQHHENLVTIGDMPVLIEQFPPCKVLVGTGDTDFLAEVREYYQALNNAGNFVDYREVSGANHAQMSFMSIGSLKDEALAFFERFRQA